MALPVAHQGDSTWLVDWICKRWRDFVWPMMCVVATKGRCLFVLLPSRESVRFHDVEKGECMTFSFFGRAVLHFQQHTYIFPLGLPSSWQVSLVIFSIVEVAKVVLAEVAGSVWWAM